MDEKVLKHHYLNAISRITQKVLTELYREGELSNEPSVRPKIGYWAKITINNKIVLPILLRSIESVFTLNGVPRSKYSFEHTETSENYITIKIHLVDGPKVIDVKQRTLTLDKAVWIPGFEGLGVWNFIPTDKSFLESILNTCIKVRRFV